MANPRIDELRRRLEREPGSRLFAQLAEELRKDGDLEEAIRVCRDGLQKQPNYPSARMTLGRALFDSGDLRGARAELESVLKGAPDNILAGRLLGECLEKQGERAAALSRFKATLAVAPGDRQILEHIHALEAAKPAASEAPTIMMPAPPAAPAWPPAPSAPSVIETTLIDVPAPFASAAPAEGAPAAFPVAEVESETFELEQPYRIEPTIVETPEQPAEAPAATFEIAESFELERPYESPATIIGGTPAASPGAPPAPPPPQAPPPEPEPPPAPPAENTMRPRRNRGGTSNKRG